MLQITNYKKSYNQQLILKIEDRFLQEGLYWLKGENGSGKSTLLKTIAGLIPFEGEIILHGLSNNEKNAIEYRRMVNYGEAEPVYPAFLKGSDLISLYRNSKKASLTQVDDLLYRLGLINFQSKKIATYSSGMVKRLSLALAFIGNPKLILLDEPLITLDKETTEVLAYLIKERSDNGVSIIMVSHQNFRHDIDSHIENLLLDNQSLK